MDFNELYSIKNEAERVNRTYDIFDEEKINAMYYC